VAFLTQKNSGLLMEFPDAHLVLWVEILATLKFKEI